MNNKKFKKTPEKTDMDGSSSGADHTTGIDAEQKRKYWEKIEKEEEERFWEKYSDRLIIDSMPAAKIQYLLPI